ncbi:MAG TPA: glycine--tRNA ligase, partial [Planctomycetota bacterium]|nr:glycine--tRNA ligase [Planctomycetota bacterium]
QSPLVWKASGHVEGFTDPMVDCKACKHRFRADHVEGRRCPDCGGELTEPRKFNLMFRTFLGAVEDDASVVYLRPETAQGIFVNFLNVSASSRKRPPFGIAQIGKSFRNEITPGNFVFRTREFEQMEMEYFTPPDQAQRWFEYWRKERFEWYARLGVRPERLRMRDHRKDELAHYARACTDVEYEFPFGWSELEGIADRGSYDLERHSEASGENLKVFVEETKTHYTPFVIEPAAGVDRAALTFLVDAYDEDVAQGETRVVLRFHPRLAPITVAILPLVKKEGMPEKGREIERELRRRFTTFYDESAAIGRRYRRQDEVGTPYCVTVDGETMKEDTVTLRERDSMAQERVPVRDLVASVEGRIEAWRAAARA